MIFTRRQAVAMVGAGVAGRAWGAPAKSSPQDRVRLVRVPESGIQPEVAVGRDGTIHLIYFTGQPGGGELFYARSGRGGAEFLKPIAVNTPGSSIAMGTIRGGQIALGKNDRVHVAWNGSQKASLRGPVNPDSGKPGEPMLYARLNDAGTAFEPERNLMLESFGLDGGGSVAADGAGNVLVAWHGVAVREATGPAKGEARRRVWIARSTDDGRTFQKEAAAWTSPTGACGCCGLKTFTDPKGDIYALYRSATESVHRDIYLLHSGDHGRTFEGSLIHKWDINACPMSSMDFASNGKAVVAAWETSGQVYWAPVNGERLRSEPVAAPGEGKGRKHPRVAMAPNGDLLLAWTEGTGWQRGGSLAWQLYDAAGKPLGEKQTTAGIPAWSFAAPVAHADGGFSILY